MRMVVSGKAMIKPMKPSKAPQMDNERSRTAGFKPIAFPITFGVTTISIMICTMINTSTAAPKIIQKLLPVLAAFISASSAVGMRDIEWR